jgi:archaellum component FlaC
MLTLYIILLIIILILLRYIYVVYYKYNIKNEIDNLKDHILKLDNSFISQKDDFKKIGEQINSLYDEIKLIFNEIDDISTKPNNLNFNKKYEELKTLVRDNHILIQIEIKDINNKLFMNGLNKEST